MTEAEKKLDTEGGRSRSIKMKRVETETTYCAMGSRNWDNYKRLMRDVRKGGEWREA